ncbi:Pfs, NACHT and Ankyrin domain protein [Metarhizium album ARSEF 1941]|uniref:Pfs, NACHT and Ankyrin domain protein n=1 Tax=Metarhizium album (strain ARSEF 1941) TaxID=1081103 RepID=A0A0B2X804_METAS|nr:Pfs, NACHT and Ankyrin domain protein [Metarhizium album ARSEF 1941]KHO01426.1 Pfs, NACHT and Ankyrin domain protein [Metarhizium album ARSEF 1941]
MLAHELAQDALDVQVNKGTAWRCPGAAILAVHDAEYRARPVDPVVCRVQESRTLGVVLEVNMCLTRGPEMTKAVFKNSWTCTMAALHKFVLGNVFGMSAEALQLYDLDRSGYRHKPMAGAAAVEPRNRIDYLTYGPITKFLSGAGMRAFWRRYEANFAQMLRDLPVGVEWTDMSDLTRLFERHVSAANTNALCGPYLLQRHPDFLNDLWQLDYHLDCFFRGTPRMLAPRVYARRDRVLACIKDWRSHAKLNFTDAAVDQDGDDAFWGSSVFRERDRIFSEMDQMDPDAMASEDFGVIWASTRNSVVASLWTVLEIISDKRLLDRVRREAAKCRGPSPSGFDIALLLENPLLQSIYAEVLRLRVHMFIIRVPVFDSLRIKDWMVPRGNLVVMSTTVAHMDPAVWNTGENGQHALDAFWADRFLKYDGVPGSGPRKTASKHAGDPCPARGPGERPTACPASTGDASYGIRDVDGAWIPYGGGQRQCPGRHFAKRDIIFTAAVLVTYFDIEPLVDVRSLKMDMRGFGLGTMAVKGAIPYRIRRRRAFA